MRVEPARYRGESGGKGEHCELDGDDVLAHGLRRLLVLAHGTYGASEGRGGEAPNGGEAKVLPRRFGHQ